MAGVFTEEQETLLNQQLDPRFVSDRKGSNNKVLKYIEGHDAIDQANRIFGYGHWGYRPLSCEQSVLLDPVTGDAVGIAYKAVVELTVRGCVAPIVEVGSQPVAVWNVDDHIISRRIADARYAKKPVDESPFTPLERTRARTVIMEAHEQAEKGAVTDALKRALRTFGDQFGNGLYGDGRIIIDDEQQAIPQERREPAPRPAPTRTHQASSAPEQRPAASLSPHPEPDPARPANSTQQRNQASSRPAPAQASKPTPVFDSNPGTITDRQRESMAKLEQALGRTPLVHPEKLSQLAAAESIQKMIAEYRQRQQQQRQQAG